MLLYALLGLITVLVISAVLFINFYPSFGAKSDGERLEFMQKKPNHNGTRFTNIGPVKEDFTWDDYKKMIRKALKGNANGRPPVPLPSKNWSKPEVQALSDTVTTAVWYGHSAFYVKMNGLNILLDPMFGDYPAPLPYLIGKRFRYDWPIDTEELPEIDVVVFSHDHYDHLDYSSVLKLKDKVNRWLVPLGLGAHLERWGVEPSKISELYWYEEISVAGVSFTCTPAQHFSGRSTDDRMHTLWASWVVIGQDRLFFSGDSGYFPGFKEIGDRYGPFDFAFMECGQYDPLWPDIHMFPEETAQAAKDVKAKRFMPIHWAGFTLSNHDWDDPINRVISAADSLSVDVVTPVIGEAIVVKDSIIRLTDWWTKIEYQE